jgi:two-component system, LytTR family, response regulator
MNVLIIEDEKPAAIRLTTLLRQYDANIEILDRLDSVKKALSWVDTHPLPELTFMDIQLADGLSFDILEAKPFKAPIIFTTAYDEYAIKAFKVNSVDYLLKPIDFDELSAAIDKYKEIYAPGKANLLPTTAIENLQKAMRMLTSPYKSRFIVRTGEHIRSIAVEEIAYFFSLEKMTYLQTKEGRKFIIDYPLDRLEEMVNPQHFFRINRKYLVGIEAIQDIITYSSSRLKLKLMHSDSRDSIVSRDRVQDFKDWLDQ